MKINSKKPMSDRSLKNYIFKGVNGVGQIAVSHLTPKQICFSQISIAPLSTPRGEGAILQAIAGRTGGVRQAQECKVSYTWTYLLY